MPTRYRSLLIALGAFITVGALLGLWGAARLTGWPQLRGAVGGLIAGFIGVRILMIGYTERWPAWLARLLGEDDAV